MTPVIGLVIGLVAIACIPAGINIARVFSNIRRMRKRY